MKKNKRGLSDIVITLIIVLLSLVAVGVVWFVVNNLIQSGSQGVEISAKCLNVRLEIKQASCIDGTTNKICNVTLSRTGTESDAIGGVKMVFKDTIEEMSSSSLIDVPGNIEPLIGKRVTDIDSLIAKEYDVNLVEITAYFKDNSGNEQLCSQTVSFNF
jgi:uncharacterized membrane protein YqiK